MDEIVGYVQRTLKLGTNTKVRILTADSQTKDRLPSLTHWVSILVPLAPRTNYSKTDGGEVKFYKDGYTDVRGRFDYASLSTDDLETDDLETDDLETARRFSFLVMSDEFGAVVREADPPQR